MPHATVRERQRGRARQLRQAMTPAETLLWRHLKAGRVDGLGFRRQTPIRNYIVDFVCHSARAIIELDGASHDFEEQQKADAKRDAFFVSEGFQILRFTNEQVMSNLEGVVEMIRQVVSSRASGAPPSLTLPHKGGGNGDTVQNITPNTSNIRGSQP
jgi:very-short-patch-repair endonuclease